MSHQNADNACQWCEREVERLASPVFDCRLAILLTL